MGVLDMALILGKIRSAQWESTERLEAIQQEKLERLVSHASENIPHYRKSLKGRKPEIQDLPVLERASVQANPRAFVDMRLELDSLTRYRTSGSSGIPMSAYFDKHENVYAAALRWHWFMENGFGPLDKGVHLTYPRSNLTHPLQRLGLYRIERVFMDDNAPEDLLRLCAARPSVLYAAPAYLAPLAKANLGMETSLRLKRIFTYAELLTPQLRRLAESSFGCAVSDRYGCIEAGSIAWECEKGSKHVYSDSMIVEILDEEGQPVKRGQYGNVVITPLWRRSMALIRYSIRDIARWGPRCSCGRGLHVISDLKGRHNPDIMLPSGKRFSGTLPGVKLRFVKGLLQFQLVQDTTTSMRVKAVLSKDSAVTRKELADTVLGTLPEHMDIEVEFCDRLPPNERGKLREFVSRI